MEDVANLCGSHIPFPLPPSDSCFRHFALDFSPPPCNLNLYLYNVKVEGIYTVFLKQSSLLWFAHRLILNVPNRLAQEVEHETLKCSKPIHSIYMIVTMEMVFI